MAEIGNVVTTPAAMCGFLPFGGIASAMDRPV